MKFLSLRWKISGILVFSNLFLGIILVFIVNSTVTKSLESELIERGRTIAQDIAKYSAPQILDEDKVALKEIITNSQTSESVEYIIIHNFDLEILTDTYNGQVPDAIAQKNIENIDNYLVPEIINDPELKLECYDIIVPVEEGDLGYVRVGMKSEYIREQVSQPIESIIITILTVTLIGIIITYFLSNRILKPILYLTSRANEISTGKLEEQVSVKTNDEIKYLAEAVERLRESLNLALSRLKKHQTQRI
ncbi:MAG: HAMP domain-containing protein [Calditrichia bacterium]|nr:HAMP domain-containing protein [Calditrichia bacterium]